MSPPRVTRELRAGPLSLRFEDGALRHIRHGEREVLRQIYVAVRDPSWATIPLEISDLAIEERPDAFAVDFMADHAQGPVHFRWKGSLRGHPDGTVRFQMDGEVVRTFKRNRIGICVLHPIDECAGQPCRLEHADGTTRDASFPRLVSPHQPFLDLRALAHEVAPGVRAEVRFEGDVFETEDQRNWSDASYKTYSTPLSLPRPVEVTAGTRIAQTVTLRITGAGARPPVRPARPEIAFEVDPERRRSLPRIGTTLSPRRGPLTDRERALLAALRLSHLRVELVPSREDFDAGFERATSEARALGLPLELALWVREEASRELERVAAALRTHRPAVASYVLLPLVGEVTPDAAIRTARALLVEPAAPIAGGTDAHFTEVNRNRALVESVDAVAFPNSPQVHLEDDTTLVENLAALGWIAETARAFAGERPLALTPVSLKPQPRPGPRLGDEDGGRPDPRQGSLLAGGWTACHLGQVAGSGFHRVTYFRATGALGLMDAGGARPPYHALAAAGELAGGEVLASRSSRPLEVDGVALRAGDRQRLLLANLTQEPRDVRLPAAFVAGRLRRLDERSAPAAARDPEGFRASPTEAAEETLRLSPHELVFIDATIDPGAKSF